MNTVTSGTATSTRGTGRIRTTDGRPSDPLDAVITQAVRDLQTALNERERRTKAFGNRVLSQTQRTAAFTALAKAKASLAAARQQLEELLVGE